MDLIDPNDDPAVPKKGQVDLGLASTMPLTGLPLTAQPAAAPPGNNLTQLATPDLQTTGRPGVLAGQAANPPLANIGAPPPAPAPSPAPAPPPIAPPMPAPAPAAAMPPPAPPPANPEPQRSMDPQDLLRATQPFSDAIRKRADEIYDGGKGLGLLANASDRLQLRHLATQIAEMEISPKILSQISSAQYHQGQLAQGDKKLAQTAPVNEARATNLTARTGLATAQAGAIPEKTRALFLKLDQNQQRIAIDKAFREASATALGATADAATMTALTGLREQFAKHPEDAGAAQKLTDLLPTFGQRLAEFVGASAAPAEQKSRGITTSLTGLANNMVNRRANAAPAPAGMPPVTAAPQAMPLGPAAGMPAQEEPPPTNGMRPITALNGLGTNILTQSTAQPANAPQGIIPPGGTGPAEQQAAPRPQPAVEGLNSAPDETVIIKRLQTENPSLEQGEARSLIHRAMNILAHQKIHSPEGIARAKRIINGDAQ